MSDGPHRSLPMNRTWRRVAARGDKHAYAADEIRVAVEAALETDYRDGVRPALLRAVARILDEPDLFPDTTTARLAHLRLQSNPGLEHILLDQLVYSAATQPRNVHALANALEHTLREQRNRRFRQVEEHYLRRSSSQRAGDLRDRLEASVTNANIRAIVTRVLTGGRADSARALPKRSGIDDGIRL